MNWKRIFQNKIIIAAWLCCAVVISACAPVSVEAVPTQPAQTVRTEPTQPAVPDPQWDSSGFVEVAEAVPDAILEPRYYSTYNFIGERIDGYEAPVILITKEAGEALKRVSDSLLEQGYRLKIYDAYRPQCAVDHFRRWAADLEDTRMKAYFYPELHKSLLFEQGYIASRSGHSRGSTVDLTLFDMNTGKDVDMGGTFDYFGPRSNHGFGGITQEQKDNRSILLNAMEANGFKRYSGEWWHYTLVNEPYPDVYFAFPVESLPES